MPHPNRIFRLGKTETNAWMLAASLLWLSQSNDAIAKPVVHTVTIEALQYSPQSIEVKAGDVVVWVNKDPFPHTVTAQDARFNSGNIPDGKSWRMKTHKKGTFPYVCTLHPTMKGILTIK